MSFYVQQRLSDTAARFRPFLLKSSQTLEVYIYMAAITLEAEMKLTDVVACYIRRDTAPSRVFNESGASAAAVNRLNGSPVIQGNRV